MTRGEGRFLTTHVGSLPRPAALQAYNEGLKSGAPVDLAAYEAALAREVASVVDRQCRCGIDIVSDGEFGKPGWTGYLMQRVTGFEEREVPRPELGYRGRDAAGRFRAYYATQPNSGPTVTEAVCVGPVAYTDAGRDQMRRDVANLRAALAGRPAAAGFLPVVAPCSIATQYRNEHYASEEAFLFAVAEALREEYRIIVDAGLMLQTDDAILANLHDVVVASGRDYRRWVAMNIDALNHALEGIPPERVRYHLCWGSWPGPHTTDVPLAEIVDLVLKVNCGAYSIEAANPRHEWEWVVWRDTRLPEGRLLLPGVISHATAHVEHPELVAQRILRFAELVGPENVIASSDCGFSQNAARARQESEIVWAKLESLAEGARLASRRWHAR